MSRGVKDSDGRGVGKTVIRPEKIAPLDRLTTSQDVLFECKTYGRLVRVSAIDPVTNTEVSVMGFGRQSVQSLQGLALRKLILTVSRTAQKDGRR